MKIKHILAYMTLCISLLACSDKDYVSHDPNAAPNALPGFDINDLYQKYSLYFKPEKGWVGDPMPFYENGKFHVFYLQDARDGAPTFHPWHEATTGDFVSFADNGEMIPCGDETSQERALGTGSVFKYNGVYYGFYTGHNGDLDPKEKILLATSTDLKNWTKNKNFELRASDGYDRNEFRDPIILKEGNTFKMLLSTRADYKGSWRAVIAQYKSIDLLNWTLDTPFYDDDKTYMLECPDIFTEGNYQYLIYSDINDRMVHYKYRAINSAAWITPTNNILDGIAYYAGKTASDGSNRYIFGWNPTRENHQDITSFDWAGSLVIHKLEQKSDGVLNVTIPKEIGEKIATPIPLNITESNKKQKSDNSSYTLSAEANTQDYIVFDRLHSGVSRITATIKPTTASKFGFEMGACGNRREVYALTFDIEKKELQLNRNIRLEGISDKVASVPLLVSDEYNVTIVIENAVCVIYVNGQTALTSRIYKMNQNPWGIFTNEGEVIFSDLKLFK